MYSHGVMRNLTQQHTHTLHTRRTFYMLVAGGVLIDEMRLAYIYSPSWGERPQSASAQLPFTRPPPPALPTRCLSASTVSLVSFCVCYELFRHSNVALMQVSATRARPQVRFRLLDRTFSCEAHWPDVFSGKTTQYGGVETYIATPTTEYPKDKAVLFLTDVFGLKLQNNLVSTG